MGKCAIIASVHVLVGLLLITVWTTVAAEGGDDNDQKDPTTKRSHRIFLQRVYPFDAERRVLSTEIFKVDKERTIDSFSLEKVEASDQSGETLPFGGVSIEKAKGGVSIVFTTVVKSPQVEKVIVKAKLILNGDAIEVTCGYRKRTPAERSALNPDQEWTYLEEPEDIKVSDMRP